MSRVKSECFCKAKNNTCKGWKVWLNGTTSVPKSVPRFVLDKVGLLFVSENKSIIHIWNLGCFCVNQYMEYEAPKCWSKYTTYNLFVCTKKVFWYFALVVHWISKKLLYLGVFWVTLKKIIIHDMLVCWALNHCNN